MLRVKAIAPLHLTDEEVQRRQLRYEHLSGKALVVKLFNLDQRAPEQLNTAEDIAASELLVREEILRTTTEEFDVILPDCVLDPAVGEMSESPVPLVGILRLAAGYISSIGETFAAVTRNKAIGNELSRKIESYGLAGWLTSVALLDVDFCLISDNSGWSVAMEPVTSRLAANGVSKLINGCSAVDIADRNVGSVLVIDPTQLALKLLGVAWSVGALGNQQ
jgi:Asp/Glu/hydantoin racemase